MADAAKRDLEQELEAAKTGLAQLITEANQVRKSLIDRTRKEELKAAIWRQRVRAIELERDLTGELYMKARHEADEAAIRLDQDGYLRAHRRLVRLRIRYVNAIDLLEKLRGDGPDSCARLVGGT